MYNCEFCNRELKSKNGLKNHANQCLENPNKIKRTFKLDKNKISICRFCGKECKGSSNSHATYCDSNPNKNENIEKLKGKRKNKMSYIGRENISNAMKKFYENNIDRHPYKLYNSRKESYPEKIFRECLEKNNIKGWVQEMQFSKYRADFCFVEYKLIVEIDGRFHDLQKVIEKDIIRTEYLNSLGYRVIRFKAGRINTETYQCLNEVLELLGEKQIEIPKEYLEKKKIKDLINLNKTKSFKFKANRIIKFKNIVETCDIDFSKNDWRKYLAKLFNYGISPTVRWMKNNMKEFYEEKCCKSTFELNKRKNK
jgi:very-short-patch-repair endonuclease